MPAGPTDAFDLLAAKTSVPSELRSAEWRMVSQWLRERSFFMAGVSRAEILDEFRRQAQGIAAGTISEDEAFKALRMFLKGQDYKPAPGQEGTIKDLSTLRRMQVTLRANVSLVRGWTQKEQGLRDLTATPCWELVRVEDRMRPRIDWDVDWGLAGGQLFAGRKIALKTDPVWGKLGTMFRDSIGVDYPPFRWGSGLGWKAVGFREAEAIGALPAGWAPPEPGPVRSPNENMDVTPRVASRELRDELASSLGALGEWDGEILRLTDPNGTRPFTAGQLAEVWSRPMPAAFRSLRGQGLMQRQSLAEWFSGHEDFRSANGTDAWEDLQRLEMRLVSKPVETLWRGMAMSREAADLFLRRVRQGIYATRDEFPLESWTASAAAATRYANAGGQGWSIVLEVSNPVLAKDVSALARALRPSVTKRSNPPVVTEGEWIYRTGRKFRVLDIRRDNETRTARIRLEELP